MHSSKIMGGFTTVVEMRALESHKRQESAGTTLGFHSTTSTNHHGFPWVFPSIHWKHGGLTTSESTARVGALMRMGSMIFPLGMGWGSSDVKSGSWGSFMKSRIQVGQGSCWQLVDFRKAVFFLGHGRHGRLTLKLGDGTKEAYQSCRLPCFWLIQRNSAEGQPFCHPMFGYPSIQPKLLGAAGNAASSGIAEKLPHVQLGLVGWVEITDRSQFVVASPVIPTTFDNE